MTLPSRGGAGPKRRGTAFEHSVVGHLRKRGWPTAVRSYASKGPWDVLAIRRLVQEFVPGGACINPMLMPPEVWMVQAKIGGYMPPAERLALIAAADAVGATPVLATTEGRRIHFYVVLATGRGDELVSSSL